MHAGHGLGADIVDYGVVFKTLTVQYVSPFSLMWMGKA